MDLHHLWATSRWSWRLGIPILLRLSILRKGGLRILRCLRRGNRARMRLVTAKPDVESPRRIQRHGSLVPRLWGLRVLISLRRLRYVCPFILARLSVLGTVLRGGVVIFALRRIRLQSW